MQLFFLKKGVYTWSFVRTKLLLLTVFIKQTQWFSAEVFRNLPYQLQVSLPLSDQIIINEIVAGYPQPQILNTGHVIWFLARSLGHATSIRLQVASSGFIFCSPA